MDHQLIELWTMVAELEDKGRGQSDRFPTLLSLNPFDAQTKIPDKRYVCHSSLLVVRHLLSSRYCAPYRSRELFDLVHHIPQHEIRQRFAVLQLLNHKLSAILPLVDFTQVLLSAHASAD